jgi:elongation factor Ts
MQIRCETDFVAKTDIFKEGALTFLESMHQSNFEAKINDPENKDLLEEFMNSKLSKSLDSDLESMTAQEGMTHLINKTRENCSVGKVIHQTVNGVKKFGSYLHNSNGEFLGKIGVLVLIDSSNPDPSCDVHTIANDLALHIAAMKPRYVSKEKVPAGEEDVEESQILKLQELVAAKGTETMTIADYLYTQGKMLDTEIKVEDFVLFTCN